VLAALSNRNSSKFYPFVFLKSVIGGLLNLISVDGGIKEKRSSEAGVHFKSIGNLSGCLSNFTGEGI